MIFGEEGRLPAFKFCQKKKGVQIFSVNNNELKLLAEIEVCDWEPGIRGWVDNSTVLLSTENDGDGHGLIKND